MTAPPSGEAAAPPARGGERRIAALLFVLAFGYFTLTVHRSFELRDEGYLYYNAARVAAGAVPHRDFAGIYGPGVFAVTGLLFAGAGGEILPVRFALAALRALCVALAFLVAREFVPRRFALLGAGLAAAFWGQLIWNLHSPYAAIYSIPLGCAALHLVLRGLRGGRRGALFGAGLLTGAALLFKQSLGCAFAYGLVLAILGAAALASEAPPDGTPRSRPALLALLAAWTALGALILLPFAGSLGPLDYAVHFLPIHAAMAVVGVRTARFGRPRPLLAFATPRLLGFGAGLVLLPGAVAALYASWGALGTLLHEMFVFPMELANYHVAVELPAPASLATLAAALALGSGGLLWLRGARPVALALLAGGVALAAGLAARASSGTEVEIWVRGLDDTLPAAVALATLAWLARELARARAGGVAGETRALLAALFFQTVMTFQIYPRATLNVALVLGTTTPLLAHLLRRWSELAGTPAAGGWRSARRRRAAATACVAVLPLLLGTSFVRYALAQARPVPEASTALRLPGVRGIAPPEEYYLSEQLAAFTWLVDHVRRARPGDAPLCVLTNEFMIPLLSGREDLLADRVYDWHLLGWDLLAPRARARVDAEALIERLRRHPDAIVVDKDDFASSRLRRALPAFYRWVDRHYEVTYRVGLYRVLRRRAA